MRWICKEDIQECLTELWRNTAAEALQKLQEAESVDKRKEILKKTSSTDIWRDFYASLPENLKKKCWYCEAEDIRADMPVDHFRPKNKVENDKEHDGYWWLAFNWENYRCACTFCNSRRNFELTQGGKACKFPLVNPEKRAYSPEQPWQEEQPDFLDPFDPDDWKLLWFDGDGRPEAKPEANLEEQRKVSNSIDIFHLHETRINRARNRIRIEIEKQIKTIKYGAPNEVLQAKLTLRAMTRETTKLSRAAIVYLRQHRELVAVKQILDLD
ncbi:HNH endonuclease [Pseudomonas sp. KU26590]|uniref:HNH endonuclease n=1 Tax=Pseudomonas sp. KU26590 TaxID=2991051 RepID=UPI00223E3B06|nr:HNH endonuclease signature motif containing protein [Pseudomonas sp. KU26590]UZJ60892.1 HNH endonuclease [Pseudomonas sp. KU26590]